MQHSIQRHQEMDEDQHVAKFGMWISLAMEGCTEKVGMTRGKGPSNCRIFGVKEIVLVVYFSEIFQEPFMRMIFPYLFIDKSQRIVLQSIVILQLYHWFLYL